jgi:putative transposase
MPRQARLVYPDTSLHVRQLGHNGDPCFRQDRDYLVYLSILRDLLRKVGCTLHAYCLMTNHVHLLLTPPTAVACALLMRTLGQRYVQYFNRRYERSGTLWEGRFRSCLVDSADYVVACYRYIERNPVKAGMVSTPSEYLWSSYAGNAGYLLNTLLTPHAEYLALGAEPESRLEAYRQLLAQPDDPAFLTAVRDATNGGFALIGTSLRSKLSPEILRRLDRKPPGPAPASADTGQADLLAELGLRPRTS